MSTGSKLELTDENILSINSPKASVGGPYVVVHTNHESRYAIVAMQFNEHRTLGIRWFWGSGGTPYARQATWFVLPEELHMSTIDTLCLSIPRHKLLMNYLAGDGDKHDLVDNW